MMNALGVWNKKKPPYATAFFVELYSDKNRWEDSIQVMSDSSVINVES